MIRSAFQRRFISVLTIIMLVWCQTIAAAQGCMGTLSAPAAEPVAAQPCHEAMAAPGKGTTQQGCESRCLSRNASLETAKIHLPAFDDLPVVLVATTALPTLATCDAPYHHIAARAAPPPLILVYCRLLN
jgi:hypothetical protein